MRSIGFRRAVVGATVLLSLLVIGPLSPSGASDTAPAPVPSPEPASAPMTVERLMARPIPSVCAFPAARYVDGVHPDSPGQFGEMAEVVGAGPLSPSFPLQAKIGDVTGNGVADGLLVTMCTYGGNAIENDIFVYRSDGHRLGRLPVERHVSSYIWAPNYPKANIVDGVIRVKVFSWRNGDAHCCPSVTTNLRFRWTGLRFIRV